VIFTVSKGVISKGVRLNRFLQYFYKVIESDPIPMDAEILAGVFEISGGA